jgi:isomerase DpgB
VVTGRGEERVPADREPAELLGGVGVGVHIDPTRPLAELTATLTAACAAAEDRGTQTVLVLRLGLLSPEDRAWPRDAGIQDVNRWERAVRRVERLAAVSITAVTATCGGPAVDLLLAADYRIATADLRLLLPVNDGQFWPGMAVHRLANQVGLARARQIVLWGHEISARLAIDIGLVDELAADLDQAVEAAALMLGRESGAELAIRRRLLLEAHSAGADEALGAHLAACDRELRRVNGTGEPGVPA